MTFRQRIKHWRYGQCPGLAGAFPYFGTKVHFPKRSLSFTAACEQGIFETENVRLINSLVTPQTTYVDVGANIGLMAVPVLNAISACRVVSFEPSPNTLPYLARTIRESGYSDRWTLVPKAVGITTGRIFFSLSSMQNSLFDGIKPTGRTPTIRQVEVEMTKLDDWWHGAGEPRVSVVKCDVEGAELDVLKGAPELLATTRPHIVLEFGRANPAAYGYDSSDLYGFAGASKYVIYALPYLIRVDSLHELDLQMANTENFLLSPR